MIDGQEEHLNGIRGIIRENQVYDGRFRLKIQRVDRMRVAQYWQEWKRKKILIQQGMMKCKL